MCTDHWTNVMLYQSRVKYGRLSITSMFPASVPLRVQERRKIQGKYSRKSTHPDITISDLSFGHSRLLLAGYAPSRSGIELHVSVSQTSRASESLSIMYRSKVRHQMTHSIASAATWMSGANHVSRCMRWQACKSQFAVFVENQGIASQTECFLQMRK